MRWRKVKTWRDPEPVQRAGLLAGLHAYLGDSPVVVVGREVAAHGCVQRWKLNLVFYPEALRDGMDPLSFIQYLGRLGEILQVRTDFSQLPALADMDPERCYLSFEVELESTASRDEIAATFEFVMDGSDIRIEPMETVPLMQALPLPGEAHLADIDRPPAVERRLGGRQNHGQG